MLPVVNISLNN